MSVNLIFGIFSQPSCFSSEQILPHSFHLQRLFSITFFTIHRHSMLQPAASAASTLFIHTYLAAHPSLGHSRGFSSRI